MKVRDDKPEAPPAGRAPHWDCSDPQELLSCRIFSVQRFQAESRKTGKTGTFHVLRCPEWVNIIPLTDLNQVVFIRQFRAGIRAPTLEIPGGMMDLGDRSPLAAARREMLEETGYDAKSVEFIGKIHPNPAVQDNYCHSFVARGAHRVEAPKPDALEELDPVLVPLAEVPDRIAAGHISHALVVVAFTFLFGLGDEFTK